MAKKKVKKSPTKKKVKAKATKKASSLDGHLMNFKVSTSERKAIWANADRYAGGNTSLWLRHAATRLKPKGAITKKA